jgi:hypothetical protein
MNIRYMKIKILFFLILVLFSCKVADLKNKTFSVKYREKNQIEILNLESSAGNITISGWAEDFIEIEAKKVLFSGLKSDLDLMDTVFENNNKELSIKAKIPARISGKIDFNIFIPYIILKANIKSENGSITVDNYLGDLELYGNNSEIDLNFQGNILRVYSARSRLDLNVRSFNSTDIIIYNENGSIKSVIEETAVPSYFDIKSVNCEINLLLNQKINHFLYAINKNKKIYYNSYASNDKLYTEGTYNCLISRKGRQTDNLNLLISNSDKKVSIQSFSKL